MRDSSLGRLVLAARHPPLWARWLLTIFAFAVLILAAVVFVHDHSEGTSAPTKSEREAEVEANREGNVVIEEDQAPHTARLGAGVATLIALERCDLRRRARPDPVRKPHGAISERALRSEGRCGANRAFRCTVRAAGVELPLPGGARRAHTTVHVVQGRPAAVSGAPSPVSARCPSKCPG